jgi:nucleotide-binding universal stress UspA family protein
VDTLLHVLELPVAWAEPWPPDAYRDLDRRSAALLDTWAKELAAKVSVPVTQRVRIGSPGAQVLFAIDEDRTVDLIAMGSQGRTGIQRLALGSVAEKIVRHAHCSVLVAHHRG